LVPEALVQHLLLLEIADQVLYFLRLHLTVAGGVVQDPRIHLVPRRLLVVLVAVVLEIRFLLHQALLEILHLHRPLKATTEAQLELLHLMGQVVVAGPVPLVQLVRLHWMEALLEMGVLDRHLLFLVVQ
jgi:hypothetical protein